MSAENGLRLCRDTHGQPACDKLPLLKAEILLSESRVAEAGAVLRNLPPGVNSPQLKPRVLVDLAELEDQSSKPEAATKLLQQSLELATQTGDPTQLAIIELRRGERLADDPIESEACFRRALNLAHTEHDEFLAAAALGDLGYIRQNQFRFDEAIAWFKATDEAAQRIPSKVLHEKCLGSLGWCYFRLGESDRALDLLAQALQIATEIHKANDQQLWLGDIGSIYYVREDYARAISYYSQARDLAQKVGNSADGARWLNNIARAYIDQSRWEEAEKFNRLALAGASAEVAPYVQLNLGLTATARGRTSEAESAFQEAIKLADQTHQPNVAWQAHSGLAELYRAGKRPEAQEEYAAAVRVLDREWLELSRADSKITFRNYQTSFYQDYVGFLSEQGRKEKALEAAESSRARLLLQKLDGRTSALPMFYAADAVRLSRDSGSVLLSYWLAPKQSYLWAVTAKGIAQFVLPGEAAINALIEQHRKAVEDLRDPLASGGTAARQLFQTLLGPVEPMLQTASRVIISPDGHLHEINFETLVVDGPKPHYWIDDATIAIVPSLGVLQRAPVHRASRRPRLLLIGDPLPADPEFPPLPHLKTEIAGIAADFAPSDRAVYTLADAYPEKFRESAPQAFSAIHFAAHAATSDESPLNSAIILSPRGNTYKLYASEVAGLHLSPDLVTISACRSAGSKAYSGEGLTGFAWAFLNAGAQNVVAGIWNVDDAAAPPLMREFYKEWREGRDPAAALRGAKLQLMRSGGAFRKPYYWGPFEVFTRQATRSAIDLAWRNSSK